MALPRKMVIAAVYPQLWINDGKGNFRLADWKSMRQMSNSSMGVDVGDINGDGLPDLFTVDMLSNDTRRLKTQIPTHTALPKRAGDVPIQSAASIAANMMPVPVALSQLKVKMASSGS